MSLICIDTQILIWAMKEEATDGQESMILRSQALIDRLDKSNKKILIPAVVVGEFLIRMPDETHQTTANLLGRDFMVAAYDIRAAVYFAKLCREKSHDRDLHNSGMTRQELRADRMIVATALAFGAECIYSHDRGVQTFGDGFIEVRDLPEAPSQGKLL